MHPLKLLTRTTEELKKRINNFKIKRPMKTLCRCLFICIVAINVFSCSKNSDAENVPVVNTNRIGGAKSPSLPTSPYNYNRIALPEHLKVNVLNGSDQAAALESDNTPADNPTTNQGATLGRVLFYDKNLSKNNTIACASCHIQANGFSDPSKRSKGFAGGFTRRHSMSLVNACFYKRARFFWDERATTLEAQVLMPFQDSTEMGMTLQQIEDKINEQTYYKQLFFNAYGSSNVSSTKISKALAQFIRSMVSISSKYDSGRVTVTRPITNFNNFTASENNGKRLFFTPLSSGGLGCIGCHSSEAFISPVLGATNNGIDAVSTADKGVYEALPNDRFLGVFKVPSLKNIAVTAPYMHDGRFATLTDVVNHYNSGIKNHINLGIALKDSKGSPVRMNLTESDKTDLIAFLKTLTDYQLLNDVKYSDPFK